MIILELFCGTAGLTACFRRHGYTSSIAIDKIKSKFPHASVIQLDLTDPQCQHLVKQWLTDSNVVAVFLAPPCGTCSLARNIPAPDNPHAPVPLRSLFEPDGLRNLSEVDCLRVSQANLLYDFCREIIDLCCELGVAFMLENPLNSLFWMTTPWRDIKYHDKLFYSKHQACAYGAMRPKWTQLCANFREVTLISKVCDNQHTHLPWGVVKTDNSSVFATSLEVHYPRGLCEAIVNAFELHFQSKFVILESQFPINAEFQAASGVQPLGNKLPPLFSPFSDVFVSLTNSQDQVVWPNDCPSFQHAKLLHRIKVGGGEDESARDNNAKRKCIHASVQTALQSLKINNLIDESVVTCEVQYLQVHGFLLEPDQFVERALKCKHPFAPSVCLPDVLKKVIHRHVEVSPQAIAESRAMVIRKWTQRALELQNEEIALRKTMDPVVDKATRGKRLVLFKEMLIESNYADPGAVDELIHGADLTGLVPETNVLPGKFCPALLTDEALGVRASLLRRRGANIAKSSGDSVIDDGVWSQTMTELAAGWLEGPLNPDVVPHTQPISRRFGVKQGAKVRPIDDFSDSGVNQATTTVEAPSLHTVDVISAALTEWFEVTKATGSNSEISVRTYDLKSAYRQIGLSQKGRDSACIAVFDPQSRNTKLFRLLVLPFGAVRSVHAFLRLARALWHIGTTMLDVMWSSFYDDYVVWTPPILARSTSLAIESLFKLTGWIFAESGDKCMPFGESCQALGVQVDLSRSSEGLAFIRNTESRVTEISASIEGVLLKGSISRVEARRLRGRMQFAESQLFGRVGKRCLRALGELSDGITKVLSERDLFFLGLFVEFLKHAPPREISAISSEMPVIFTDACYEPEAPNWVCGIGGVLVLPTSECQFFSIELSKEDRNKLGELSRKQIIFEAETLAAVVALCLWMPLVDSRRLVLFVDNEGTKFSLLKAASDNQVVDRLSQVFASIEHESRSYLWLSRVASYSNIADEPSRGKCDNLVKAGAKNISDSALDVLSAVMLKAFDSNKMGKQAQASSNIPLSKKRPLQQ